EHWNRRSRQKGGFSAIPIWNPSKRGLRSLNAGLFEQVGWVSESPWVLPQFNPENACWTRKLAFLHDVEKRVGRQMEGVATKKTDDFYHFFR
ncbi:MAG: hypothetical protein K6T31_03335, partial [Alicyclobacillus sp.]|nr:hypothetical protein [Alicyclobacillus sp.]